MKLKHIVDARQDAGANLPLLSPPVAIEMVGRAQDNMPTSADTLELSALPPLARALVYGHLGAPDLAKLSVTSKFFYQDVDDPEVWRAKLGQLSHEPAFEALHRMRNLTRDETCLALALGAAWSSCEDQFPPDDSTYARAGAPTAAVLIGALACVGCLPGASWPMVACSYGFYGFCLPLQYIFATTLGWQPFKRRNANLQTKDFIAARAAAARALEAMDSGPIVSPLRHLEHSKALRDFVHQLHRGSQTVVLQQAIVANEFDALALLLDKLDPQLDLRLFAPPQRLAGLSNQFIRREQISIAQIMIRNGADVDVAGPDGQTPQSVASEACATYAERGSWDVVERLLSHPFNAHLPTLSWQTLRVMPGHLHQNVTSQLMIALERMPDSADTADMDALCRLLANTGAWSVHRHTALGFALLHDREALAQALHRAGAQLHAQEQQLAYEYLDILIGQAQAAGDLMRVRRLVALSSAPNFQA